MDQLNRENCRLMLASFIEENEIPVRQIAKAIGCSEATVIRILAARSFPTDEMIKQIGIMIELGFDSYSILSNSQKENISETIGAMGSGTFGFSMISAVVSRLGIVPGLSATGITSGLSALGKVVKGGMKEGVMVVAAIPFVAGATGYAIIKGIKYIVDELQLNVTDIDERWEIVNDSGAA